MRHPLLFALPLLLAGGGAAPMLAQTAAYGPPELPGVQHASRVTAGRYAADPSHTLVQWRVRHFGFNDYFGLFGDATGTLDIDPANLSAAVVDVTIPVARVTTASAGLTAHLLRPGKDGAAPDFFGPTPAPARFTSTRIEVEGMEATIHGDLTLNGVTRPVVMDAQFVGAGANPYNRKETIGFHAATVINRSEWGIGFAVPLVSDAVQLKITAAFEKE